MMATASAIECEAGVTVATRGSEALDVDPVRHLEHVGHVVADQDDRQAALTEVPDELEHLADSFTPSAVVGSSRMTTRLPKAAARATATAWRWPPDSVSTAWVMS